MTKPYKMVFKYDLSADEKGQFIQLCDTLEEAESALKAVSLLTIKLQENGYMSDMANIGMVLQKDDDGDWIEVDADGNEI